MQLTTGADQYPVWTLDGQRIVFGRTMSGPFSLYWQAANGTGTVERLTNGPTSQYADAVAPDGTLVVQEQRPGTNRDLFRLRLGAAPGPTNAQSEPLIQTAGVDINADVSSDGRWLAYQSSTTGSRQEVYVQPFPNTQGGHYLISTAGGSRPLWAKTGKELFYLDANSTLMSVPVQTTPTFSAGNPVKLFDARTYSDSSRPGRAYDVSRDGQRFVMVKDAAQDPSVSPASLIVVVHWFEDLKAQFEKF